MDINSLYSQTPTPALSHHNNKRCSNNLKFKKKVHSSRHHRLPIAINYSNISKTRHSCYSRKNWLCLLRIFPSSISRKSNQSTLSSAYWSDRMSWWGRNASNKLGSLSRSISSMISSFGPASKWNCKETNSTSKKGKSKKHTPSWSMHHKNRIVGRKSIKLKNAYEMPSLWKLIWYWKKSVKKPPNMKSYSQVCALRISKNVMSLSNSIPVENCNRTWKNTARARRKSINISQKWKE